MQKRYIIQEYVTTVGISPFGSWLNSLGDTAARARIQARIFRFELGNLGDHKNLGDGVFEAGLAFGPGYRLYFGKTGSRIILLLTGGHKGSQRRDVEKAKQYWKDFKERKNA